MNITFLTQYYPPESNAPAARVSRLARLWAAAGDEVTVITGHPNHPEGRVYPGHRASSLRVVKQDGVRVVRVPVLVSPNRRVWRRSMAFASFWGSASMLSPWLSRPDVVVATTPQILVGLAGAWLAAVKRVPFVLDVRDLWPDSIVAVEALPAGHPVIRGLARVERALYGRADHVVVVTESFRKILEDRGVKRDRITFVPNGVDTDLFSPTGPASQNGLISRAWEGRFVLCYAGTLGMAHGLGTLLDAAKILKSRMPRALFVLAGGGAEAAQLAKRVKDENLDNVEIVGRLPREDVPTLLRRADVCVITLRPSPLFTTVLPSKIFEAMGCARPILLAVDGEARRLVERAGAGVFVPPGDPVAMADAIVDAARHPDRLAAMGEAGRVFARDYDRERLAETYRRTLHEVVGGMA